MRRNLEYFEKPELDGEAFFWSGGSEGILLIHGLAATTAEVRLLAEIIHRKGYTVAAPLLPGHNTHPADLNRVHRQQWLDAAEEMYLRLSKECDRIAIGGESTGAVITIELAYKRPEAAALLLYAPALKLYLSRTELLLIRAMAPFIPWAKRSQANTRDMPWKGYTVRPLKGVVQLLSLQKQALAHLGDVRQPALIVQGRLDQSVHPSVPDMIYSRIGSKIKEIHWMEDSTHCLILDREYEQVGEITLQFLDRIWSSRSEKPTLGSMVKRD